MLHLRATYFSDKCRKTLRECREQKHCNIAYAARAAMPRKTKGNAANTFAAMPQQNKSGNAAKTFAAMPRKTKNKKAAMPHLHAHVVSWYVAVLPRRGYMFLFVVFSSLVDAVNVAPMRPPSCHKPHFVSSPKLLRHRQLVPPAFHVLHHLDIQEQVALELKTRNHHTERLGAYNEIINVDWHALPLKREQFLSCVSVA